MPESRRDTGQRRPLPDIGAMQDTGRSPLHLLLDDRASRDGVCGSGRRRRARDLARQPRTLRRQADQGGEFVVREDHAPFTELDVRGGDDAPSFVAARDDLVEQARPVDVEGYVAELVQYDQVGTAGASSTLCSRRL